MASTRDYSGRPPLRRRGFSLVELMVAMGIALFLIAGIVSAYTFLGRNLIRYSNQQQLEARSRRALQTLAEDVHAATDVTSFAANQLVLSLPYVHSDGSVTSYTVTYAYDANAQTLTRAISGTAPPDLATATLTLLTGASVSGGSFFKYFDRFDVAVTTYPFRLKKIEIGGLTLTSGTASAGTQSTYTGASARLILRGKHVVTY